MPPHIIVCTDVWSKLSRHDSRDNRRSLATFRGHHAALSNLARSHIHISYALCASGYACSHASSKLRCMKPTPTESVARNVEHAPLSMHSRYATASTATTTQLPSAVVTGKQLSNCPNSCLCCQLLADCTHLRFLFYPPPSPTRVPPCMMCQIRGTLDPVHDLSFYGTIRRVSTHILVFLRLLCLVA